MIVVSLLFLSVCCWHRQRSYSTFKRAKECSTIRLAWDDIWPDDLEGIDYTGNKGKFTPTGDNSVYVKNAHFEKLSSGAIIFSSNDNSKLLVEFSTFLDVTNNITRGAISMENGGESVINKVCALRCYSAYDGTEWTYGMFIHAYLSHDPTKKNDIVDSSVCSCKEEKRYSFGTLDFRYANNSINSVNLTDNVCKWFPAISVSPEQNEKETCTIEYCTIRNNFATAYTIIDQDTSNAIIKIANTNMIECSQGTPSYGIINVDGHTTIVHCTLLNNDPNYRWFFARTTDGGIGQITVIDCTIDVSLDALNTSGTVILESITPTDDGKSFINALKHTENEYCLAQFDFVGSLTPDFGFPNNLCSKKPDHMKNNDDDMNVKSSKRRVFEYIFVVSCLNVDPSVGLWDDKE